MRFAKKTICMLLTMFMVAGLLSGMKVDAKEISIAAPKIKVKLVNKKTGAKITIEKTKDAEGYEISLSGTPANSEYCDYFKYKDSNGDAYMSTSFSTMIEKNGKAKSSFTYKFLQPGTYTVKVRSWNNKKDEEKTYSGWSKEKTFTLKESATNGYSNSYDFSKVKKGDVVKFGAYEQDLNYTNGKEAIEWIVLKKTNDAILLLSKYALDRLPYNKDYANVTWETCSLRKWLNSDFIKNSFNKTEQGMIRSTTIENADNAVFGTAGGNDTKDKVFLLSQLEMIDSELGFSEDYDTFDVNRKCVLAWYKNIDEGTYASADNEHICWWWLRSPGDFEDAACGVGYYGSVSPFYFVNYTCYDYEGDYCEGSAGVRPALYVDLKS